MIITLFPTNILIKNNCGLDIKHLEQKCLTYKDNTKSDPRSNVGGYQGHYFENGDIQKLIRDSFPVLPEKPINSFKLSCWININGPGNFNERHSHDPHAGTFYSGVFYVKAPPNCGRIRFYDPRPHIQTSPDMRYFNDGDTYRWLQPESNMLLMFPAWLKHDVEINKSTEERISVAFNIHNVEY